MRRLRVSVWLSAFLFGAALPAFCQAIVPPNGSGFRISADTVQASFRETVYSTGPFDAALAVYQNSTLRFCASGTVCTSGPMTDVSIPLSFASWGLKSGDMVIFVWTVRHRTTEGGSLSSVVSLIPVGPAAACNPPPTTTTPPPTTSRLLPAGGPGLPSWARREDVRQG